MHKKRPIISPTGFLTFLLVILSATFDLYGQRSKIFSGDSSQFIGEMHDFMQNISNQYEPVVDEFYDAWGKDSIFSLSDQQDIMELSRALVKKNAKPYPHFVHFLSCMLAFKKYNTDPENYSNWLGGMKDILDRRKITTTQIDNVLEFTDGLLRSDILSDQRAVQWKASSNDYKILDHDDLRVEFKQVDLVCYAIRDSIRLFNTSGTVYPVDNIWKGHGGLVTWERGGYSRDSVFANLVDYSIDLSRSEYTADSVTFTNKYYFKRPLTGVLHDKVKLIQKPDQATYPQFDSYTKEFTIKNLYKDINYKGGLSMQGAKMVGTGTQDKTAKLEIYRNDTLVLTASSVYFGFKSDRVSSLRTSVTIHLKEDSIFHPDLFLTYRVQNRELTLLKTDNFSSQGPYSDSYHKINMNFDQLIWRMDEDEMHFSATRGAAIGNAYFESENYFNYNQFMSMMMLDQEHPLVVLRTFSKKYGSDEFPVDALANYMKMPINEVEQMAMRMANGGFVFYDVNTGIIKLRQRLTDYLAASVNKIDYDVIGFNSQVQSPLNNAVYNLKNYDLTINGIPKIQVSDSQNVVIYPKSQKIILKRNRNFQFDGVIQAGLLTFFGNNFFFSYDSFKINLQNVDSLNIRYLTGKKDNYGLPLTAVVKNSIHSITGNLLIDKPDNKSGRKSYPEYPIFESKENSYVYYEGRDIQNGVYESNDFFFEVYPFVMDSLDNFNVNDLVYKGQFVSAGIFPDFENQLSVQPDNSLGFRQMSPPEGYPVYGGKGTYFSEIWLSNKGLKGDGKLDYLTSTTYSKDFNFYPDSMNTNSIKFEMVKQSAGTEYPMVKSINNYIHWLPYEDEMYAKRTDTDFTMFNDTTNLKGNLKLDPKGLIGEGLLDLKNSELRSNQFRFLANDIYADTADFNLKSLYNTGFTVLTQNINSHVSFTQHKGWFKSNEDYTMISFPDNKYVSYIDKFQWDMDKKELALGSPEASAKVDYTDEDSEPEGPRYISLDKDQDSLNFVAPLVYYDYKKNLMNAHGVKFIEVADARIYPDSGRVTIERDAKMRMLENARIIANRTTKFYKLHTANVAITSRDFYSGIADYDYQDENGKKELIHFKEIKVDSSLQTIANGDIYESADFYLSPVYKYQGKVFMSASDSLLTYNGSVKIVDNCDKFPSDWLYFKSRLYPKDIYIPMAEQPVNIDRNKIYNGLYMYYDSVHIYPAFMTAGKSYSDKPLITSSGYLHYDKAQQLFKIGSKEKINDFTLPDDYLSLNSEECKLYGEGKINLGQELGQLKLNTYGSVRHDINANETTLDLVLSMDFYIADPVINLMAADIDSAEGLLPVDLTRQVVSKANVSAVGAEMASRLQDELSLFGTIKDLPPELKHTIVFNQLTLRWNDLTNSYQSTGKIGVGSINGIQVNKQVDGYLELQIKRSGDILDFYLQVTPRIYYYFGYTRGVMQTLSSDRQYVETIMNMKTRDRKMKVPRNTTPYIYMISTDRKRDMFYRKYRDAKEGKTSDDQDDQ